MASSDMPEILGLSHRAFVMRDGAVVGELDRDAPGPRPTSRNASSGWRPA